MNVEHKISYNRLRYLREFYHEVRVLKTPSKPGVYLLDVMYSECLGDGTAKEAWLFYHIAQQHRAHMIVRVNDDGSSVVLAQRFPSSYSASDILKAQRIDWPRMHEVAE